MIKIKFASEEEKTDSRHDNRKIFEFIHMKEKIDIYMTKHGHFRILEKKNISLEKFGSIIKSIGVEELEHHFKQAKDLFPIEERRNIDWKTKTDYVLSVYDVVNEIVIMFGLHPHLRRITIITIIPRIDYVVSNDVFGTYRIDNDLTKNKSIKYTIPKLINMKYIKIAC